MYGTQPGYDETRYNEIPDFSKGATSRYFESFI